MKPVLTYNCELWSQISKYKLESLESNKLSLEETYFDNPAEELHLQFCRTVLGVSRGGQVHIILWSQVCPSLYFKPAHFELK